MVQELKKRRLDNGLGGFFSFMLLLIFLTYRSFNPAIFYVNWCAGLLASVVFLFIICWSGSVSKTFVYSLLACTAWLIIAILVSPFATDVVHHFKILAVSLFYTMASLFITEMLFKSNINISSLSFKFILTWVLVNGFLLGLFLANIYTPVKRDFSGVFHDRNVFSITTLILCAFFIGGLYNKKSSLYRRWLHGGLIYFSFVMILISKSVTGIAGIVLLLILIIVYSNTLRFEKRFLYLILLILFIVVLLFVESPIRDRLYRFYLAAMGDTGILEKNESAYIRRFLITEGWLLVRSNWVFGVGLDNARLHVIWPLRKTGSFLHNNYLDILSSGGVVMFLLYYSPIVISLVWLIKRRKAVVELITAQQQLWFTAVMLLCLKLLYDITWTTYFEFGMVYSVVFAIYSTIHLNFNSKKMSKDV